MEERQNTVMSKQDKNCQVPTPAEYVEQMLDYVGYKYNLPGRKVMENSCGEGNILIGIVRRYITDAKRNGHTAEEIAGGLEKDIVAYETDQKKAATCLERLDELISLAGLPKVRWNIRNEDFLKREEKNVKFIIGNPPYITYHDLAQDEREFLQGRFSVCKKGRFDYCYAFIEASINALADDGKMIYLIPFSIFRNRFATCLRAFLREHITKIIDYRSIQVFPGVICSAALILCENKNIPACVEYEDILTNNKVLLERSDMGSNGKKWIFYKNTAGNRRFGDSFIVHNSVATLYNKAFLFTAEEEEKEYYITSGRRIEKGITLPAVSTKSSRTPAKEGGEARIIFPYQIKDGKIVRYEEEELRKYFPYAWEYLYRFYSELGKRKADKKAKWFEYGRSQALTGVPEEKLIIPMVITDSTRAYIAKKNTVPYAGYFVTLNPESDMALEDAKIILDSIQFHQYVKAVGTPTTISSYRISVHDISEYLF